MGASASNAANATGIPTPTEIPEGAQNESNTVGPGEEPPKSTVDRLVPMGQQYNTQDLTLLDIYMSQPTTNDLSTLDSFPLIKKLFIKHNTMLPTSASAERLFSAGGVAFGQRRHSYTDKNFEIKVTLKTNTEFWI